MNACVAFLCFNLVMCISASIFCESLAMIFIHRTFCENKGNYRRARLPNSSQQRCKWYGYFPTVFEFDPVWKDFYPSVSDSEYSISVTNPYSNTQKLHFYDVDIHCNLIRQKLALSVFDSVFDSVFEQKYENKYDISNIRPYPIRLHPQSQQIYYYVRWFDVSRIY